LIDIDELNTGEQAAEFLKEIAITVWQALQGVDKEGASSISTALVVASHVLIEEMEMADQLSRCLITSIREGRFQEDEAIQLLQTWKKRRIADGVTSSE
jgi:hypothetical protein